MKIAAPLGFFALAELLYAAFLVRAIYKDDNESIAMSTAGLIVTTLWAVASIAAAYATIFYLGLRPSHVPTVLLRDTFIDVGAAAVIILVANLVWGYERRSIWLIYFDQIWILGIVALVFLAWRITIAKFFGAINVGVG